MEPKPNPPDIGDVARAFNRAVPIYAIWFVAMASFLAALAIADNVEKKSNGTYHLIIGMGGSVVVLTACIINMVAIFRLTIALAMPRWAAIAAAGLCLALVLGFIAPLVIIGKARSRLRRAGIRVGILRIHISELEKLPTHSCPRCGYPRDGLAPGTPCPECGSPHPPDILPS
jgi:hypothetical protein